MFTATTHGISVSVMPVYIDERSDPEASRYFWAYRVIIENKSVMDVQLISRYWKITDSNGVVDEVEGDGVVGKQPIIKPGKDFTYSSGCPLNTSSGIMVGHYIMQWENGDWFQAEIPAFPLDLPDHQPVLN